MPTKKMDYPAKVKVFTNDAGEPTGQVQFYASIYNNVDLVGDRVLPGAFDESLKTWRDSGKMIPIVFSHKWDSAFDILGYADPKDVTSDEIGLKVLGQFDISDNPTAKQVHRLMGRGIVSQASFAYEVQKERKATDGANELVELGIIEVGPCLKGANAGTGDYPMFVKSDTGEKAIIAGSFEERQCAIQCAVTEYFEAQEAAEPPMPGDEDSPSEVYVYIEATFDSRVVVCVCDIGEDTKYYSFPYGFAADGTVILGTPSEVELTTTVTPVTKTDLEAAVKEEGKSIGTVYVDVVPRMKVGRRNNAGDQSAIQSVHDAAVTLGAECAPDEGGDMPAMIEEKTVSETEVKADKPTDDEEEKGFKPGKDEDDAEAEEKDEKVAAPAEDDEETDAETKDAPNDEDDVDPDGDGDAFKPKEAVSAPKSADAEEEDDTESEAKTEEPDGAKVEEQTDELKALQNRAKVDVLEFEATLL